MKQLLATLSLLLCLSSPLVAFPAFEKAETTPMATKATALQLDVHTASNHVLVVSFTDSFFPKLLPVDPLENTVSDWTINGSHPKSIHHGARSMDELPKQKDGTYPIETLYSIYLDLGKDLVVGSRYEITGPFGTKAFTFDDTATFCESIKVNQAGYHPESGVRYANLGIFMGDGGSEKIAQVPSYRVIDDQGDSVYSGHIAYRGDDTLVSEDTISSGEHVYRLDLSEVPEGGPYRIHIPGWGVSYPFEITYEEISSIFSTALRGLYHQRCGIALEQPYTAYVRDACHTEVAITRTPWEQSPAIEVKRGDRVISIFGGHHDAGDFDRRPFHTIVPIMLLGYFEAFPSHFSDGQANIPESGNGLPDILDEALWAIESWRHLQILDRDDPQYGGIMAGTETDSHPEYGIDSAFSDNRLYGTWAVSEDVTAFGAGMMAQAARIIRGYGNPWDETARELLDQALLAWRYVETHADMGTPTASIMYASLQLYLTLRTLGEDVLAERLHTIFRGQAIALLIEDGYWPQQYRPGNIMANIQTVHFVSYLLTPLAVDSTLAADLEDFITDQAASGGYMGFSMEDSLYPLGATKSLGWGAATSQGRYADVHAFAYRFAKTDGEREKQFSILSQYADYALGLNPLGVSYMTGLGEAQPKSPLHLDSWFSIQSGIGPVPGILVYGPSTGRSGASYQRVVSDSLYPRWEDLPQQRRWADGWSLVNNNEFSIWETMIWNIALYGVLDRPKASD